MSPDFIKDSEASVTGIIPADGEYYEELKFEKKEFENLLLNNTEFYSCTFTNIRFFKSKFNNCRFEKCLFKNCDLSLSKFTSSLFIDVKWDNCKLMGIDWTSVSKPVKIFLCNCILTDSSFYNMDLIGTEIIKCTAHNTDFEKVNLRKADCSKTDFNLSRFAGADLSGADFTEALNYNINPETTKIKNAKFSYPEVLSLLSAWNIIIE